MGRGEGIPRLEYPERLVRWAEGRATPHGRATGCTWSGGGVEAAPMDDGHGRQVRALRWLGDVPMRYRSAIRVLPMDRRSGGRQDAYRPARWRRRWSTVLEPILVGENASLGCCRGTSTTGRPVEPNTVCAMASQIVGDSLKIWLGWQEHQLEVGDAEWTGYSQCSVPRTVSSGCRRTTGRTRNTGWPRSLYGAQVVVYFLGSDSRRRAHRLGMRG